MSAEQESTGGFPYNRRMPRRVAAGFWCAAAACAALAGGAVARAASANPPRPAVVLRDPAGAAVDPFRASESSAAVVLLFASVECPISNRYAPVVQRLHAEFASKNVAFWLVYPNPADTAEAVREHLRAYGYPVHALLDPRHELVALARVSVTPEAAVFDREGRLAYHGRIDNRYVSFGVERPAATEHDLALALGALLAGRAVPDHPAPAIGCYIADFVP